MPAAALRTLTAAGIRLEAHGSALHATPRAALTDEARKLIRDHKAALVDLLTKPRRLWLIRHPDGRVYSHSFTPPATLAEIAAWYPSALSIEPEAPPVPAHRQPQAAPQAPAGPIPLPSSTGAAKASGSPL